MSWPQKVCAFFDKWKALHRIVTVATCVVLSKVFIAEAVDRNVDWTDYIAYSFAMSGAYSTTLLAKGLDAIVTVKTGKASDPVQPAPPTDAQQGAQ